MYTLQQEQILNTSADELWDFISHPANLNKITPPELDFTIISNVPQKMYDGLLIEYDVKLPLLGHSKWVTEIKHIVPGKEFVDEQRIGPYSFWYHRHELEKTVEGTKMIDNVSYQPPFGPIGKMVNALLIRSKLEEIFGYRSQVLNERYNN
jgi:ligand-binding SRPBCC domain-containing protein